MRMNLLVANCTYFLRALLFYFILTFRFANALHNNTLIVKQNIPLFCTLTNWNIPIVKKKNDCIEM